MLEIKIVVPESSRRITLIDTHASASYSLSGHISFSLRNPASFILPRRRLKDILLKSIIVTFEGKAEIMHGASYNSVRLCSVSCDLVSPDRPPIRLSCEDDDSSQWEATFDLRIPGWLPGSSDIPEPNAAQGGIAYGLFAQVTYVDSASTCSIWSMAAACSNGWNPIHTVEAPAQLIMINRIKEIISFSPQQTSLFPCVNYLVKSMSSSSGNVIPSDLLACIQVMLSTPECVGLTESSIPLCLRVRSTSSRRSSLRLLSFEAQMYQLEQYRTMPSSRYSNGHKFPTHQPPAYPLLSPHPLKHLCSTAAVLHRWRRRISLVSRCAPSRFRLSETGCQLNEDWAKMDVLLPILTSKPLVGSLIPDNGDPEEQTIYTMVRPLSSSPFHDVAHELGINISCEEHGLVYDLHFSVPIKLVCTLQDMPQCPRVDSQIPHSVSNCHLPAYSQLYHCNGEPKVDWLPTYLP